MWLLSLAPALAGPLVDQLGEPSFQVTVPARLGPIDGLYGDPSGFGFVDDAPRRYRWRWSPPDGFVQLAILAPASDRPAALPTHFSGDGTLVLGLHRGRWTAWGPGGGVVSRSPRGDATLQPTGVWSWNHVARCRGDHIELGTLGGTVRDRIDEPCSAVAFTHDGSVIVRTEDTLRRLGGQEWTATAPGEALPDVSGDFACLRHDGLTAILDVATGAVGPWVPVPEGPCIALSSDRVVVHDGDWQAVGAIDGAARQGPVWSVSGTLGPAGLLAVEDDQVVGWPVEDIAALWAPERLPKVWRDHELLGEGPVVAASARRLSLATDLTVADTIATLGWVALPVFLETEPGAWVTDLHGRWLRIETDGAELLLESRGPTPVPVPLPPPPVEPTDDETPADPEDPDLVEDPDPPEPTGVQILVLDGGAGAKAAAMVSRVLQGFPDEATIEVSDIAQPDQPAIEVLYADEGLATQALNAALVLARDLDTAGIRVELWDESPASIVIVVGGFVRPSARR